MTSHPKRLLASLAIVGAIAAGCGGPDLSVPEGQAAQPDVDVDAPGVRVISIEDGATLAEAPVEDLVIIDVRTPGEIAEGQIDGAIMMDFHAEGFADDIAALDPNGSYMIYCESGNRSGKTAEFMQELGFSDVSDLDGGHAAWESAGLPSVTP